MNFTDRFLTCDACSDKTISSAKIFNTSFFISQKREVSHDFNSDTDSEILDDNLKEANETSYSKYGQPIL